MIVLDASAVVEMLIDSEKGRVAQEHFVAEQSHAPELISYEVLSAIRGRAYGKRLTRAEAFAAMLEFERIEDTLQLWPLLEVMTERAVDLSANVSPYDATYVALAEILPCPLVTADARLGRAVEDLIDVIVL